MRHIICEPNLRDLGAQKDGHTMLGVCDGHGRAGASAASVVIKHMVGNRHFGRMTKTVTL